jgi:hypothetical protein
MLTGMTDAEWTIVLEAFNAVQSIGGEPGHDDRKFLEALHYLDTSIRPVDRCSASHRSRRLRTNRHPAFAGRARPRCRGSL